MSQSPSLPEPLLAQPNLDPQPEMPVPIPEIPSAAPPPPRKSFSKRKRAKAPSKKYLAMGEHKLSLLNDNLKLVPFSPCSSFPDLSNHEQLFRALSLWDFANLRLDQHLRFDLITSLIAFYDPSGRKSLVNGLKISVSKADLARALSLPVKKKPNEEPDHDLFRSDEAGSVLSEFISSYMLFHLQEDDDACILPQEVADATRLVKEGQADKVYWVGLIWGFVEKELHEATNTKVCYYASHLQQLIKHQHPKLLEQAPMEVKAVAEPDMETSADVTMEDAEDEDEDDLEEGEEEGADGVEKTKSLEELADAGTEEMGELGPRAGTGLSLGLSGEENSGFDGAGFSWGAMQQKGEISFGHSLRPCGSNGFGFESLNKPAADDTTEADEEGEQYMRSFQRMDSSTDLLQAMENVNSMNMYNTGSDLNNPELNSGDFLSMSGDPSNNGSFFFTDTGKRPLTEIDEERDEEDDEDDDDEEGVANVQAAKRVRSEMNNWVYEQPSDEFSVLMAKAHELYNEKKQATINVQMQVQYLSGLVQDKDQVIHQMERSRIETQQKYHAELSRYEQEMNIMAQLVSGYKQALKKARHAFSEYRKKFPEGEKKEKPVYGDVPNGGGLVICAKELERLKLERQIEMKQVALGMIGEFEREWSQKFHEFTLCVSEMERRVGGLCGGIGGFKEEKEEESNLPSAECTEM